MLVEGARMRLGKRDLWLLLPVVFLPFVVTVGWGFGLLTLALADVAVLANSCRWGSVPKTGETDRGPLRFRPSLALHALTVSALVAGGVYLLLQQRGSR
jgi:hypothetical protein